MQAVVIVSIPGPSHFAPAICCVCPGGGLIENEERRKKRKCVRVRERKGTDMHKAKWLCCTLEPIDKKRSLIISFFFPSLCELVSPSLVRV